VTPSESAVFNEPGLFLIAPSGTAVYDESLLSMPVIRPRIGDLLGAIDHWAAHDHPGRGDA
jgi:hypothetical protein